MCFFKFILRDIGHMWAKEGQRERERESQAGSVLPAQSLTWGQILQIMRSWPEPKSTVGCLTDWATWAPPVYSNVKLIPNALRDTHRITFDQISGHPLTHEINHHIICLHLPWGNLILNRHKKVRLEFLSTSYQPWVFGQFLFFPFLCLILILILILI